MEKIKSKNTKLNKAKFEKNDEFYTFYEDIEKEIMNYKEYLIDKIIYCNCDNPKFSNFIKFFNDNKEKLQIKEVIYSYLKEDGTGGYNSIENKELFNKADIIITNPPFSLSNDFIDNLINNNKKFLIVSSNIQICKKNTFQYFMEEKIFFGINKINNFYNFKNDILNVPTIWLTNLKENKDKKILNTIVFYKEGYYDYYDNTKIINIDKIKDIPIDYEGEIGVPITFLKNINKQQFKIIKIFSPKINGKEKFYRLIIKHNKKYLEEIKLLNTTEKLNNDNINKINEELFNENYYKFKGKKFLDIFTFIKKGNNYVKNKINEEQYNKLNNKEDYNLIIHSTLEKIKKEYILKNDKYQTIKKDNYYLKSYSSNKVINKNLFDEEYYFNNLTFEFTIKEEYKEIDYIILYHINNIINEHKELYNEKDLCKNLSIGKLNNLIL